MNANRWMIVAGRWERYLVNAATVLTVLVFMAWLAFPPSATTAGWPWKLLAFTAASLAGAAAQELATRPTVRVYAQALSGLNRAQRVDVLKAVRGKMIPSDPAVLAAAIRTGAISQAYGRRYAQKQKTWWFFLPGLYILMASVQLIGHVGAREIHQALLWAGLGMYFGVSVLWATRRRKQLDRAVSQLRAAAVYVPIAASAAAHTSGPVAIPPQRTAASWLIVAVLGVAFAGAVWAWGEPFPRPKPRDCSTIGQLVGFMSTHEDMLDATKINTGTPALSEYEEWSRGLQSYASKESDPVTAGHLKRVGDLSTHALDVVRDLRGNASAAPPHDALASAENDYQKTMFTLMNEEQAAVTSCTDRH